MLTATRLLVTALALATIGCGSDNADTASTPETTTDSDKPEVVAAAEQVEKMKPSPGTGNVQGKVMFNSKPVAGIEVTLCEEFARFGSGCGGQTFTAKTDAEGVYVIPNVPPKEYQALMAKVFDTDSYVFATQGYGINSATYKVEADKTLFAANTNLFKSDLKVANPKAGSSVAGAAVPLAWQPYEGAAYYKISLFADSASVTSPYINYRVDSSAFTTTKPLPAGGYRFEVEAYNSDDIKLATNSNDLMFTVQ